MAAKLSFKYLVLLICGTSLLVQISANELLEEADQGVEKINELDEQQQNDNDVAVEENHETGDQAGEDEHANDGDKNGDDNNDDEVWFDANSDFEEEDEQEGKDMLEKHSIPEGDDDNENIQVEPSEFAASNDDSTHDENFDYGDEDQMNVAESR